MQRWKSGDLLMAWGTSSEISERCMSQLVHHPISRPDRAPLGLQGVLTGRKGWGTEQQTPHVPESHFLLRWETLVFILWKAEEQRERNLPSTVHCPNDHDESGIPPGSHMDGRVLNTRATLSCLPSFISREQSSEQSSLDSNCTQIEDAWPGRWHLEPWCHKAYHRGNVVLLSQAQGHGWVSSSLQEEQRTDPQSTHP